MQSDNKQIPEEVFSFLETADFPELKDSEQEKVLSFFTEEEYNDMRFALKEIHLSQLLQQDDTQRKTEVLNKFNEFHSETKKEPNGGIL